MKKIVALGLISFVASCGVKNPEIDSSNSEVTSETATSTEQNGDFPDLPTVRAKYNASNTILTDLIHTKLIVSFDWNTSRLIGTATIDAKPHFYPSDSLILDAQSMEIKSVKMNGNNLQFTYENDKLKIKLGKTFKNTEKYSVVIDYVAKPEEREVGGSDAITSDKGLYFINPKGEEPGKMPQIWTQGETSASSVWFPTIDSPNAKTTQETFITVEDKYVTLSNGKFVGSIKNSDGTRTDHWKQELPHAPYLFMMGIGEFKIVKDYYTRQNGAKMEVNYYVEPEWEQYGDDIFGNTPEMIDFFSKRLGVEYPWDKYHQIVVRDYVSGAMENTGAVIFGDFVYKTDRELIDANDESTIAHELFHHWFGDLVTCESWSNLPLNESFANYSQYLWDEYKHGLDEADYLAEKEADGYYQTANMQGSHNLIWFDYNDEMEMFDGHSYNKGGRILHMLRNHIGDDAFFTSLNLYLTQNKFKPAEFHQLRLAFEEVTGQDLNWFFKQWFEASNHPELEINHTEWDQKVELTIIQKQELRSTPIYKLPIEVAVFDDAGKHIYPIIIDQIEETFTFPVNGKLKCVVPDFQQMLLAQVTENKPQEHFQQQYYLGERWRARDRALRFGTKKIDTLGQQLILDALKDEFWGIRILAIEKAGKLKGGYKAMAKDIIAVMAVSDESSAVRAAALNYIDNSSLEKRDEIYAELIARDSSYLVVSTALSNLAKMNPEQALILAKKLENEPSAKMKMGIGSLYSSHGDSTKFSFFQKELSSNSLGGFEQLGMMNLFTVYLARQDVGYWESALPVYNHLLKTGNYYTQMFFPQNMTYLASAAETNITKLKTEISNYEEANNPVYAEQARKKLKLWETIYTKLTSLK